MRMLKKGLLVIILIVFYITFWSTPAKAMVSIDGTFTADKSCEALQSIRKKTNPGNLFVYPEETYEIVAKNNKEASHYLIKIDRDKPTNRWVAVDCGKVANLSRNESDSITNTSNNKDYLLALSWQPAFCETLPSKKECLSKDTDTFEASHFVLHGLWPQPKSNVYCGVSKNIIKLDEKSRDWPKMPPLQLSEKTWSELQEKMPGTASGLHLHEWYKHGTCYSESPEEYYQESLALLAQINDSPVRDLFVKNLGEELDATEIRQPFNVAFGENSGTKVKVKCREDSDENQNMITELWINLKGEIDNSTLIEDLIKDSPTTSLGSCQGEIDPAPVNEA